MVICDWGQRVCRQFKSRATYLSLIACNTSDVNLHANSITSQSVIDLYRLPGWSQTPVIPPEIYTDSCRYMALIDCVNTEPQCIAVSHWGLCAPPGLHIHFGTRRSPSLPYYHDCIAIFGARLTLELFFLAPFSVAPCIPVLFILYLGWVGIPL